jgi:hypothetical protein
MADWYICDNCKIAFALFDGTEKRCSPCGESGGEITSREQMKEGVEAGAYHNIDLRTAKRSKKGRVRAPVVGVIFRPIF